MKILLSKIMKVATGPKIGKSTGREVDGCATVANKLCFHEGFPERSHLMWEHHAHTLNNL